MQTTKQKTHFTPPVVAEQLGCSADTVLAFIRSGELKASNLGRAGRSRWRIAREDLDAFLELRSNQKIAAPPRKKANRDVPSREWV